MYRNFWLRRLRLDVAGTEPFLHQVHRADSTERSCEHEDETAHHFFLECPRFSIQRRQLHLCTRVIGYRSLSLAKMSLGQLMPTKKKPSRHPRFFLLIRKSCHVTYEILKIMKIYCILHCVLHSANCHELYTYAV